MAKNKKPTTETAEAVSTSSLHEIGVPDAGPSANGQPELSIAAVRLLIPFVAVPDHFDGYLTRHVDTQLDACQRRNLRGLVKGLMASGERLANGKPVENHAHAIKWLLEQIDARENGDA